MTTETTNDITTIETQSFAVDTPLSAKEVRTFTVELFSAVTGALATTDKKGNRVGFERSIVFASKDARAAMAIQIYTRQCENGVYTPLLTDALSSGLLSKSQREVADALLGTARNISKINAIALCQMLLNLHAGKTLKGQKAFYYSLLGELRDALAA
jgi:hypothetical protein